MFDYENFDFNIFVVKIFSNLLASGATMMRFFFVAATLVQTCWQKVEEGYTLNVDASEQKNGELWLGGVLRVKMTSSFTVSTKRSRRSGRSSTGRRKLANKEG